MRRVAPFGSTVVTVPAMGTRSTSDAQTHDNVGAIAAEPVWPLSRLQATVKSSAKAVAARLLFLIIATERAYCLGRRSLRHFRTFCHAVTGNYAIFRTIVDYEALSKQLVRALRGVRSQGATNRRLRRSSNVCHTWERGTRHPTASDFLRLAALAKIDVARVLAEFGGPGSAEPSSVPGCDSGVTLFLRSLTRGRAHAPLAREIGRDRNTIARWLSGETEPRLPDLLRVVDSLSLRLVDFVAGFVDPEKLPAVRAAHRDLVLQRRLAYEMPWAHAVLRVLELDAYRACARHEPGFIARFIGIDLEEERRCVEALAKAGQIRRRGGKWAVQRVLVVDTREDPVRNISLKKHWAMTGFERMERSAKESGNLFSYNLFAISEEGLDEIRKAHLEYFARLRSIVAACEKPTRLVLANVQLISLERNEI